MASIDEPWEYQWIGFNGANASEYLNRTSIVDSYAASCKEDSKIPKIISNMCEISKAYNPLIFPWFIYRCHILNLHSF
jgi:hypothetical protein